MSTNDTDTGETCSDESLIALVSSIMSAMLVIVTAIGESPSPIDPEAAASSKISLETITKCLYLFPDAGFSEMSLLVIRHVVRLGLGRQQFSLMYFLSWIGNHLVPREDRRSLEMLGAIVQETLPLCIRQKRDNSCDKVQIIVKFLRESATLPPYRALVLFQSVVGSLGGGLTALWMQLLFMAALRPGGSDSGQDECLIRPLLSTFPVQEQLFALSAVISFLAFLIRDPSRKRKFLADPEVSSSPMNKKRKTALSNDQSAMTVIKSANSGIDDDFLSVKDALLAIDRKMDTAALLRALLHQTAIHLTENSDSLMSADADVLKEFIGSAFAAMQQLGRSQLPVAERNEFCLAMRRLVESVGGSLARNTYLELVVDLVLSDVDAAIKSRCLELLSGKFSTMAATKTPTVPAEEDEVRNIVQKLVPVCQAVIVTTGTDSCDWNAAMTCMASIVALGFARHPAIRKSCDAVFRHSVQPQHAPTAVDKIVLANIFLKNYVDADCYEELTAVFSCGQVVIRQCLSTSEFNSGALESALALIHGVVSREDSHKVGWREFGRLLEDVFRLVAEDCRVRQMSRQSCDYQRFIRVRLSQMPDTAALVTECVQLLEIGVEKKDLTFLSGSLSLLGCHLAHLNKTRASYQPSEEELGVLWDFLCRSLAIDELLPAATSVDGVRDIAIKAFNQLCHLQQLDAELLPKLFLWAQQTDLSPSAYLQRHTTLFNIIRHIISKANSDSRVIDFINRSDCVACASGFLKHLSVEILAKSKRRKIAQSAFVARFPGDRLIADCPLQVVELIRAISDGVRALLGAEHKCGLNMTISDETIELIGNVCRNMLSIDQFVEADVYRALTEKHTIPLIVQIATNAANDEALLTPLAMGLCKHFTELSPAVLLAVVKALADLKTCLGNTFDMSIRDNVANFLEDCKLHGLCFVGALRSGPVTVFFQMTSASPIWPMRFPAAINTILCLLLCLFCCFVAFILCGYYDNRYSWLCCNEW